MEGSVIVAVKPMGMNSLEKVTRRVVGEGKGMSCARKTCTTTSESISPVLLILRTTGMESQGPTEAGAFISTTEKVV